MALYKYVYDYDYDFMINMDRLQRVQNQLARAVLQAPWTASATDMCRQLHWLFLNWQLNCHV